MIKNFRNLLEHSRPSNLSEDRMEITYANPYQATMLNTDKGYFSALKA
jgi:hypothetical protein